MTNILNVTGNVYNDESITRMEFHSHTPYSNTSYSNNDEIRIPIQNQDLIILPSQSYLYIEGKLVDTADTPSETLRFCNGGVFFLWDEIRYELAGTVIDRNRNPGITSTMKTYLSYSHNEMLRLHNAGWDLDGTPVMTDKKGYFNVCIPMRLLFGFCEDFKKVIVNTKHELVLIRSSTDANAAFSSVVEKKPKVVINKIIWKVPHISLSDSQKLKFLQYIENGRELAIPFRSWDLHEYPLVAQAMSHSWTVKAAYQLEKPRYVIVGFQTNRKGNVNKTMAEFDHCDLTNLRVHLNSEVFPYDNLNINYDQNQFATLYEMFVNFQSSYYYKDLPEAALTPKNFKNIAPLVVINCSHQNENVKTGVVDIQILFETSKNIPANTSCFCLIIHDRLVKYNPLNNAVRIL